MDLVSACGGKSEYPTNLKGVLFSENQLLHGAERLFSFSNTLAE